MYHAILIDQQFLDKTFPTKYKIFAQKLEGDWNIFGIEVEDQDKFIKDVQKNMRPNETWYAHIYNEKDLIVIFKDKIIKVTPHQSTWQPIYDYGKSIGISEKQLDFWPNRFQDERHYFAN